MDENFKYKTIHHNLQFIAKQVNGGNLTLSSDLVERSLWNLSERSQFIETLLVGMPTEPIWCEEDQFGRYIVIDGSEKLRTLLDFIDMRFSLHGLRLRKEYEGFDFSQLPYYENLGLVDRYNFHFIITNYDNSPQLRHQLYRTLLRSRKHFKAQIARNFAFRGAADFLQWIRHNSARYIRFKTRYQSTDASDSDVRVDEIFLSLMLFIVIERNKLAIIYDIPHATLGDALDQTMALIDSNNNEATECANILLTTLARMKTQEGQQFEILLSRGASDRDSSYDGFVAKQFYQKFIHMRRDRQYQSRTEYRPLPLIFSNNSPAYKLIDYISSPNR